MYIVVEHDVEEGIVGGVMDELGKMMDEVQGMEDEVD